MAVNDEENPIPSSPEPGFTVTKQVPDPFAPPTIPATVVPVQSVTSWVSSPPANPTDLATTAAWTAAWAKKFADNAELYFGQSNWISSVDRYNNIAELPDLPYLNFDIPEDGVQFLNFADEIKAIHANWPIKDNLPDFADPNTAGDKLDELLEDLTHLEALVDNVPGIDPADPNLSDIVDIAFDNPQANSPFPLDPVDPPLAFTGSAPPKSYTLTDPTIPPTPVADTLPTLPDLAPVVFPDRLPTVGNATFDGEAPDFTILPLTHTFSYVDATYTSSLRDPLVAKLLDNLTNGGYGIETNDEEQLWNRSRDRETQAGQVRVAEIKRQAAGMSFPMPQGSLYAALAAAAKDVQEKVASLNREITLKRADMYVENRKFTIQEINAYEKTAIELYHSVQERALNVMKATAEMAISKYDADVRYYNAQLDTYKTAAQIFETEIRADMAKLELFKSQIGIEELRLGFNKQKIDLYTAQFLAIKQKTEAFMAQIEAANIQVRGNELKIRGHEAELKGFIAELSAKEQEYNHYAVQKRGQITDVELYKAEIEADKLADEKKIRQRTLEIETNDQKLKKYQLQIGNYKDRMDVALKKIGARGDRDKQQSLVYDMRMRAYNTLVGALREDLRLQLETHKLNLDQMKMVNESQVATIRFAVEKLDKQLGLIDKTSARGIEFYNKLLATSMSSVTALAVKKS